MTANIQTLVSRLYRYISEGSWEQVDSLFAPQVIEHQVFSCGRNEIRDYRRLYGHFRAAFPDLAITVESLYAMGGKVVSRFNLSGSLGKPFFYFAPGRQPVQVAGIDVFRFHHDKIVEHWGTIDQLSLFRQLDANPAGPQFTFPLPDLREFFQAEKQNAPSLWDGHRRAQP